MNASAIAILAAAVVMLMSALAEHWHSRRIAAVARLAFGPTGQPRRWTCVVPTMRVVSCGLLAWGLTVLCSLEPQLLTTESSKSSESASAADVQRVVLVLDVSPSMNVVDAGLKKDLRRRDRVLEVVEGILSRIAISRTKFSVVVFFTSARPVVVDATDVNVVRNLLDNMPLVWSFQPGETQLLEGVRIAGELARDWPANSTTLLICTDGDTVDFSQVPKLPRSVRGVEILAVGDPLSGTLVGNHTSRQDAAVLRRLAAELRGSYHNVNTHHMATSALADLARVPPPPPSLGLSLSDLARIAVLLGAVVLTSIPITLEYFGSSWNSEYELPRQQRLFDRPMFDPTLDSETRGASVEVGS